MESSAEQNTANTFSETYPLDFQLSDLEGNAALYILDKPHGESLYLKIANTSNESIVLMPDANKRDTNYYNFELRFRPGTLIDGTLEVVGLDQKDEVNWNFRTLYNEIDGTESFFLTALRDIVLRAGESIVVAFHNLSADPVGGSRSTTIELIYLNTVFEDDSSIDSQNRAEHISVVKHTGLRNAPLHTGIIGSNTILNVGNTMNELPFQITNSSYENSIRFFTEHSDSPSKFILSFDFQEDEQTREWALGTASQVNNIHIHLGELGKLNASTETTLSLNFSLTEDIDLGTSLTIISANGLDKQEVTLKTSVVAGDTNIEINEVITVGQGDILYRNDHEYWRIEQQQSLEWVLTPIGADGIEILELPPGEHFLFTLTNIITDLFSGSTNMYIRYENLPDYWDGEQVVILEKAPQVYRRDKVGIGTAEPKTLFSLKGNGGTKEVGITQNQVGGTATMELTTSDSKGEQATRILLRGGEDSRDIEFYNGARGAEKLNLIVTGEDGHVGIGSNKAPINKLDVSGSGVIGKDYAGQETAPEDGLLVQGSVGVGTSETKTPFSLKGNGGTKEVGITQNQVGGTATMELTTSDSKGEQATRILLRGDEDSRDIEFYSGASGAEKQTMIVKGDNGHVGIGIDDPQDSLHVNGNVRASKFYDSDDTSRYVDPSGNSKLDKLTLNSTGSDILRVYGDSDTNQVAYIENKSTSEDADVLRLKANNDDYSHRTNYIIFQHKDKEKGAIDGGSSGFEDGSKLTFRANGADYAERLSLIDSKENIVAGDIVGVYEGKITKKTQNASQIMAISSKPIIVGNDTLKDKHLSREVAFIGQVSVKVTGAVNDGDYILPSGLNDGTGIAVAPDNLRPKQYGQIVGRAWESSTEVGEKKINTAVGLQESYPAMGELMESIQNLQKELEAIKTKNGETL